MTIGLLERLEETHKYNLREWLEETLSRQYGMCCSLREEGWLTKEQIIEKLEDASNYTYIPTEPRFITKDIAYKMYLDNKGYYEGYLKESLKLKEKYEKDIFPEFEKIKSIAQENNADLVLAVLEAAESQFDIIKDQWSDSHIEYYKSEINKPFTYDEEECKKWYEEDLKVYNMRLSERENRTSNAAEGYKEFLNQLDKVYEKWRNK